ncbi:probable G-protein coupled receptor No18 [Saccostrea echinata]|uniref:probable G-protein coupled receptor No18 n=1 Tax=Saccostrea echinata TaxID=191078 RepID=UPI002A833418|nr:probable G-protein coupled receptor No18 [Saccostrea echinata]XP_061198159.1 probable G-protein coupled receptor No18 [Saccostrea echinata]
MENGRYNISALSLSRPSELLEKLTLTGSSLLLIVAIIVNILAHFVIASIFLKSRPFRQSRHFYILSVALSDFFTGMTIPFLILESMNSRWTLEPYLCPVFLVIRHSMMFISLLSVLLFTLDRWWSISFPLSYRARQSQQKSVLVLIIVWIFAAIVHIPAIFVWNSQYMHNGYKMTFCQYPYYFDRMYTISLTVLEFILPIAFLLTLNASIYVVLVKRRNATEIRRSLSTSERAVRSRKDNQYPCCIPNCHCKSNKSDRLQPRSTQLVKNHSASELPSPSNSISIDSRSKSLEAVTAVSCQYSFLRKESDNLVRDFLLRQSMRALCSVGILTICAILFRSPYVIAILIDVFSCPVPSGILVFLQNLTVINASINPFLYNLGSKTIKKTLRSCIKSKLKKTDKFGENLASMYCILERNGKVSTILNQRA